MRFCIHVYGYKYDVNKYIFCYYGQHHDDSNEKAFHLMYGYFGFEDSSSNNLKFFIWLWYSCYFQSGFGVWYALLARTGFGFKIGSLCLLIRFACFFCSTDDGNILALV